MAGGQHRIKVRRAPTLNVTTVVEATDSFPSWFAVRKVYHEPRVEFLRYIVFSIKD